METCLAKTRSDVSIETATLNLAQRPRSSILYASCISGRSFELAIHEYILCDEAIMPETWAYPI